jgi:uncharacterized coiled-coil DUF342 family protein
MEDIDSKMQALKEIRGKVDSLKSKKVRLSTQLEEYAKQLAEIEEMSSEEFGVVDVSGLKEKIEKMSKEAEAKLDELTEMLSE